MLGQGGGGNGTIPQGQAQAANRVKPHNSLQDILDMITHAAEQAENNVRLASAHLERITGRSIYSEHQQEQAGKTAATPGRADMITQITEMLMRCGRASNLLEMELRQLENL